MISGLNQEIDILGRVFHFQTELTDQGGLSIRTEVFVGGKVVATRESQLEAGEEEGDEDEIRARMKEQHNRTLATFVARARRYQERGVPPEEALAVEPGSGEAEVAPELERPEEPPGDVLPAAEAEVSRLAPPSEELYEAAAQSIRIRKFFGRFREQIGQTRPAAAALPDHLESASRVLEWMTHSPLFAEIRVDEQVRCHLIREQIDDWLAAGRRDLHRAEKLWTEVATFADYLVEVNRRSELVAFDQELLIWALSELESRGVSEGLLSKLQLLYGRHPQLDLLLAEPGEVAKGAWIARLRSLLTLL